MFFFCFIAGMKNEFSLINRKFNYLFCEQAKISINNRQCLMKIKCNKAIEKLKHI